MKAFGTWLGKRGVLRGYSTAGSLALVAGSLVLATGCGFAATGQVARPPAEVQPTNQPSTRATPSEQPNVDAASAFKEALERNLSSLATESPQPASGQVRDAFVSSGAQEEAVEVSIDVTPTGLEVDAVTGATPFGEMCLFGHIADGVATVTELPGLSDGTCFIGDQR